MAGFGFHLLVGTALIAAAGCAQQPQRTDLYPAAAATPSAVAAAAAPTTSAPAASASAAASLQAMQNAVSPRLLVFAHDQGFTQVAIRGGDYYFCKSEDPMGSIIPVHQCIDQAQMDSLRVQVEQQQLQLSRVGAAQTVHHKDQ